ncbi:hypothetical protein D3C76_1461280 [compost metagenome]
MAHPFRPFMLAGVLGIEVSARGLSGGRFALFHGRFAGAFGMDMITVFARWEGFKIGGELQSFIRFGNFHRPDGLTYPL